MQKIELQFSSTLQKASLKFLDTYMHHILWMYMQRPSCCTLSYLWITIWVPQLAEICTTLFFNKVFSLQPTEQFKLQRTAKMEFGVAGFVFLRKKNWIGMLICVLNHMTLYSLYFNPCSSVIIHVHQFCWNRFMHLEQTVALNLSESHHRRFCLFHWFLFLIFDYSLQ